MGAGWFYYHKYPPKRKCPFCGKRQYLKRLGSMSNGADVWIMRCQCRVPQGNMKSAKIVASDGYET